MMPMHQHAQVLKLRLNIFLINGTLIYYDMSVNVTDQAMLVYI